MRSTFACVVALVVIGGSAGPAAAAEKVKAGWTRERLDEVSTECADALVRGRWESSARDHGGDPSQPVSDAFRKKLAPEIARIEKLCACAVREGAKRHALAQAEAAPADFERAVSEAMSNGTCKLAP